MPAGVVLDYFVYPEHLLKFLFLRLLCSVSITAFLVTVLATPLLRDNHRIMGLLLAMLPPFFMSWMILDTEGAASPYYAGLNLVILITGFVLSWTFKESFLAVLAVIGMYVLACFVHGSLSTSMSDLDTGVFFNNLYFLVLTGIVVVTGSHFHHLLRFREFALRYELEQNRKIIEENNRKLVELDQSKSRFFANISHELRTPLTLLLAPLDTLRGRYGGLLGDEGQEMIAMMRDNGMRLLKLINDLLDLVRLEEGRVKIEKSPVELDSFVRGLAASVQHTAATRGVAVSVEVEEGMPRVTTDRDKLEKTLLNLLFNALKFTNEGGQVTLKVVRADHLLVLSVSDTGIGISKEHLGQLFQRFWQVDGSSHRKQQGAGIGLSLVKEFTEVQGGTVRVESELGSGTTFTVELPFSAVNENEAQEGDIELCGEVPLPTGDDKDSWLHSLYREAQLSPAASERLVGRTTLYARSGGKTSTVLVADDEPDMLRFVRAQLGSEHQVLSAKNGREAVDKAIETQPDVIVLDMMMPVMDGIEACRVIRGDRETAQIPIIMLTARADEETKLAALAAGANDFIAKPFSVTELHVRVQNLIEGHFSRMELTKKNQTLEDALEMLRETEMQLLQSEKLASIGELSAGMSHEVKNPLNYALTGVYALKKRAAAVPEADRADYEELVATVEEGVRRVMDTVNTLRELVHPQVENRQEFTVQEAVDAVLRLLRAEWKGQVSVHTDVTQDLTLFANKSMILLVFLNLLKNSMDALKESPVASGDPAIWIEGQELDGKMLVRVRDNGLGISVPNQSKVFDILGMGDFPGDSSSAELKQEGRVFKHFFSTKAPGAGMGMGLSICRRIIRAHGGKISFRTEPGSMCEFIVELPVQKRVEVLA